MKQSIPLLIIGLLLIMSCQKKSVQLPKIEQDGITDIYDYSQIWAFYKQNDTIITADININNTISTTHWFINIDKRLPMSEVVKVLDIVKSKRNKKSIHSAEGKHNYLSYANPKGKTIALLEVDSLSIKTINREQLKSLKQDNILVLYPDSAILNHQKISYDMLTDQAFVEQLSSNPVFLSYQKDVNYQTYLECKVLLNSILPDDCRIAKQEYCLDD